MSDPSSERDPVQRLAEEFAARCRQGEQPSVTEYTDKYPQFAERIRALFPVLVVLEQVRSLAGVPVGPLDPQAGDDSSLRRQLGDYRILREVGRGGMGVVYEAVQESLGRHVALKILPFHRLMEPTRLERFKREARAAAQLHHTNIVPVFGVGVAEGVHYYAMQFIEGHGLDVVLEEVRRLRGCKSGTAVEARERPGDLSRSLAQSLLTGRFEEAPAEREAAAHEAIAERAVPCPLAHSGQSSSGIADALLLRQVQAALALQERALAGIAAGANIPARDTIERQSDLATQTEWQYCRSVAQVGVQVAEALAYAHKQRILHRDIKPSNLLLDTGGTVWITDFGLAKAEDSDDLTSPGDIVGTVRFMAPERFQDKATAASDVYSVGITLYELLTLRPAFADSDRARLVERVSHEEPPTPRALDPQIPRDLETIVLKAMAKEPAHRYASALALAEDLRRFVNNEPIQARPVGQLERLWRWRKRNPVIAGLSAAVLLLLLLVAGVGSVGYVREARLRAQAERRYYAASMGLVREAWESHNMLQFQDLLDETAAFPERGFEWYYWQRLRRVEHLRLVGHQGGLNAVAFAPDGQRLATGGNDGTARVWDATSGKELSCLRGHRGQVMAVAFAPDGHWLVTGSMDGTARIWDIAGRRELRKLQGQHKGPVLAVGVTPDGKRVVTGSEDRLARVWDAASGQVFLTLQGPTPLPMFGASMVGLLSAPHQRAFLAVSALYPGRTGHTGPIWAVALLGDGRRLVTGSQDQTARVWDLASGRQLLPPLDHTDEVASVAASADGQRFATANHGSGRVWDASSGREILTIKGGAISVAFSPDGTRVVAGDSDGFVRVWDIATRREMLKLKGQHTNRWASCFAFSPDGQRLAAASLDGTARVWDLTSGRGTPTLREHQDTVFSVALTPDGHRMVTGGADGMARIWDAASCRQVSPPLDHTALDHTSWVISVAVSADGQRIVTGTWDSTARNWLGGTARVWDAVSGRELLTLKPSNGPTGPVRPVLFTPDGRWIVTGNWDGKTRIWDATSGRELRTFEGHIGPANRVAVTPDGQRLVTGGRDGMVNVWDMFSGRQLLTFNTHSESIMSLALTPDGQRIVTGSSDGTARLWDMVSGHPLLSLQGHAGSVNAVAVIPDPQQRIVTGSEDGTVRLWDVASRRQLLFLKGHAGPLLFIAVTPDGLRLITASEDGTVKIWEAASRDQADRWAKEDQEVEQRQAAWQRPGASATGFIQDWLVLLPLALAPGLRHATALEPEQLAGEAHLKPRAGERVTVAEGEYTWRAHHAEEPVLDFNRIVRKQSENSVAYAVSYVISEAERSDLLLQVGTDDDAKVYLNGQQIFRYAGKRHVVALDPVGPIRLHKGTNVLVLKVVNDRLDWQCCARFVDREGNPAQGLRISLTPDP